MLESNAFTSPTNEQGKMGIAVSPHTPFVPAQAGIQGRTFRESTSSGFPRSRERTEEITGRRSVG